MALRKTTLKHGCTRKLRCEHLESRRLLDAALSTSIRDAVAAEYDGPEEVGTEYVDVWASVSRRGHTDRSSDPQTPTASAVAKAHDHLFRQLGQDRSNSDSTDSEDLESDPVSQDNHSSDRGSKHVRTAVRAARHVRAASAIQEKKARTRLAAFAHAAVPTPIEKVSG